jgi:transposase
VAVDETSFRRGQDYVSVFACLDEARVVFATPGRDASVYGRFVADLAGHGGRAEQVSEVCQDMSESFLIGALEHLSDAEITFDRYHAWIVR